MKLYGTSPLTSMEEMANSKEVLEMLLVDDILRGTSEQIKEFCESEEARILQEKDVLKKPTMMRLSKADDEKRRVKLMAYQIAKAANDPELHREEKSLDFQDHDQIWPEGREDGKACSEEIYRNCK